MLKGHEAPPIVAAKFWLPSDGIPYLSEFPDFPDEVQIGSFDIETEAILASSGSSVDKMKAIVERVAKFPTGFSVDKLLVADEMAIVAIARGQTYGDVYQFSATCPACDFQSIVSCRVPDELPVKRWSRAAPPVLNTVLPVSKDVVVTRMLCIGDEVRTAKWLSGIKFANPNQPNDALAYIRDRALQIVSVNGGLPDNVMESEAYLRALSGQDLAALREHINGTSCGIRYEYIITCDKCAHVFERTFPIQTDFFRPNRPRRANADTGSRNSAPGAPQNGGAPADVHQPQPS